MKRILENPKTSLVGLFFAGVTIASVFHLITADQTAALIAAAGAFGFTLAKDAKQSDTKTNQDV